MTSSDRPDPEYQLGYSDTELRRLAIQHEVYGKFTRQLFVNAGISPGMKVLDVGSGAGDVSMLAAEMVGDSGEVLGVEIDPRSVQTAKDRVKKAGLQNVKFEQMDVREGLAGQIFDAVIGRWVLMWVGDPVAVLTKAKLLLKTGGIVAFQESEFTFGPVTYPETPSMSQVSRWNQKMMEQGGPEHHMGYKLYETFVGAGFPAPNLVLDTPAGGGTSYIGYEFIAESVRSLLPMAIDMGIPGSKEIEIDTLAERIRDEVVQSGGIVTMLAVMGAWSHKE